ncbi:MAG TPA: ACT domain-containing protein, partial [Leptolyngbyaceae cyanobacterium M65_K2018_010]|nr:ACT domain-containing protein [Leptolyngbyaceae cyanobacterium M65_K2018_010]
MANLTPNSSYSLSLRLKIPNRAGMLARVTQAIAEAGGNLGDFALVSRNRNDLIRVLHVDAFSEDHVEDIVKAVKSVEDIEILEIHDRTFQIHEGGKISVESKLELSSQDDLAMAYTPGVGRVCREIAEHPDRVYDLTIKGNTVAIVTD